MGYKIRLLGSARKDIKNVGDYIRDDLEAPETAQEVVRGILESILVLRTLPSRHALYDDIVLAQRGIRQQYYKNYIVFYKVFETEKAVEVLAILHMRVDTKASLYRLVD
ncbi:MAG: type II toxin-antitoxin system RelE/ParE family toxin [Christensenella sp.]